IAARPLAWPILWIDAIALPVGLVWLHHPFVGIASAAPLQRRWMGTKLAAASLFLLVAATSRVDRIGSRANRVRVIALALVLAAIGADAFTPWMYAITTRMPAPLSLRPAPLIWRGGDGGGLIRPFASAGGGGGGRV